MKSCWENMLSGNDQMILALDYSITLKHGIRTRKQLIAERKKLDPVSWATEYENRMITENTASFFNYSMLNRNQTLKKAFYPQIDPIPYAARKNRFAIPKQDGEIRVVSCDIAMVENNDNSVFTCIRCLPENISESGNESGKSNLRSYRRQVPYIYSSQGGETMEQALMIKRIFEDFDADYCVIDSRNAGISVIHMLCRVLYDDERDTEYPAWSVMNDDAIVANSMSANPQIFAFSANARLNSEMAFLLRQCLVEKRIDLLININDAMEELQARMPEYLNSGDPMRQVFFEKPFLETGFLINELINLEYEKLEQTGLIRIHERGSALKDRYSSLAMGNYFIAQLERDLLGRPTGNTDISGFLAMSQKPTIYHGRSDKPPVGRWLR